MSCGCAQGEHEAQGAQGEREHGAALPEFFEPLLAEQYGAEDVCRVLKGCACRRATTLRANPLRMTRGEVAAQLDAAGVAWEGVAWYGDAFVLAPGAEQAVRDLPAYGAGGLYLQSLSSMLPPLALGLEGGGDVLDMCAAPGGKTTQMAVLGGGSVRITACEMSAPRAERLEHNLRLQGARNVTVMRTDARRLDPFFRFDRILLDAPCSGSGTLWVGDQKLHRRFTPALVQKCMKQQRALLAKALEVLKPGGTLVYSTCSVLRQENEAALGDALRQAARRGSYELVPVWPHDAQADGIPRLPTTLEHTLCVCPTERYEGFFMARVQRNA